MSFSLGGKEKNMCAAARLRRRFFAQKCGLVCGVGSEMQSEGLRDGGDERTVGALAPTMMCGDGTSGFLRCLKRCLKTAMLYRIQIAGTNLSRTLRTRKTLRTWNG